LRIPSKRIGLTLAAVAVVIAAGVALTIWPRHWRVTNQDGSVLCTISRGWSAGEVAAACGAATKVGDQPKVAQSLNQICSAPCELRGRHLVFYDCDGKVASVERVRTDWQGCVLP
jgi:hypothetical protein